MTPRALSLTLVLAACTRPATSPPADKPGAETDTTPAETDVVETDLVETDTPDSAGPADTDPLPPDTDTQDTDIPYEVDPWTDDWSIVAPRVRPMAPCTTERARIGTTPYPSAQAALDAAQDFDIVALCPGAHAGGLRLPQVANVEIRSVSGNPADTWIDTVAAPDASGVHTAFALRRREALQRVRLSALGFRSSASWWTNHLFYQATPDRWWTPEVIELRDVDASQGSSLSNGASVMVMSHYQVERGLAPLVGGALSGVGLLRSITLTSQSIDDPYTYRIAMSVCGAGSLTIEHVSSIVSPTLNRAAHINVSRGVTSDTFPPQSLYLGPFGRITIRDVILNQGLRPLPTPEPGHYVEINATDVTHPFEVFLEDIVARDAFTTRVLDVDARGATAPVTVHVTRADFRNARSPYPGPSNDGNMYSIDNSEGALVYLDDVDLRDPGSGSNLLDIAGCDQDYGILTRHILDPALGPCPRRRP